jgi:lipopolysaccharide biosynthesis protein
VTRPLVIAFYLPQFHPIPENDEWWGPGFTEWRTVASATPQFRGHRQPHVPADLGFYDLRLPETRAAQAELASAHGIDAFCWYHYWFGGRRLLERPFDEVLKSGEPDFPFVLCWANEGWTRAWDGRTDDVLVAQDYSAEDDERHGAYLAEVMGDTRYLRVDGKPLLLIYRASQLPDPRRTTDSFRAAASRAGIGDVLLGRVESFRAEQSDPTQLGFDVAVEFQPAWPLGRPLRRSVPWRVARQLRLAEEGWFRHRVYSYADLATAMAARRAPSYRRFPGVTPKWDNTPRRPRDGVVLHDSTPAHYEQWLRAALERGESAVFINAWNEWGEGNHLEPDLDDGLGYLHATKRAVEGARA